MEMITIISFTVGIVSILLAVVAMFSSKATEKRSQDNFEKTQMIMHEIYDKTKDALAQIDKKAEIIDTVVQRNQEQLINTMTNIINETFIPKKPDIGEEISTQFLNSFLQNPDNASKSIENLMTLAEKVDKYSKR